MLFADAGKQKRDIKFKVIWHLGLFPQITLDNVNKKAGEHNGNDVILMNIIYYDNWTQLSGAKRP